jgi:hypothetical protein
VARSAMLYDLEAVAVQLRLMQPVIASRDGLGCRGDTGADELRGHAQECRRNQRPLPVARPAPDVYSCDEP